MPADPVSAGRKGGQIGGKSKSPAKVAAARRNGFQRVYPAQEIEPRKTTIGNVTFAGALGEQLARGVHDSIAAKVPAQEKPQPKVTFVASLLEQGKGA